LGNQENIMKNTLPLLIALVILSASTGCLVLPGEFAERSAPAHRTQRPANATTLQASQPPARRQVPAAAAPRRGQERPDEALLAEQRRAEQRRAEQLLAEQLLAEQLLAEQLLAEQLLAEQLLAEQLLALGYFAQAQPQAQLQPPAGADGGWNLNSWAGGMYGGSDGNGSFYMNSPGGGGVLCEGGSCDVW